MKKIYKIMVFVLMLALAIGSAIAAPITIFAAGPALVGAAFALRKMPTTGKVNQEIKIPKGEADTGTTLEVVVKDPYGNVVATTEEGDFYKFTATKSGNYTATYTATTTNGSKATTKVYTIKITGKTAKLEFAENSALLMQDKIGAESKLVLPYPTIKVDDEEVNGIVNIAITDPKHNVWTSKNQEIADYTNPISEHTLDGKAYTVFSPAKYNNEVIYGTYTIEYQYNSVDTGLVRETKTVQVSKNYSVENQKITFTWNGSMPESAVLGNEITLPTPVTVDANNNSASVATYTTVEVKYHGDEEVDPEYLQDYKFTPMHIAKSGSYYEITYKIYTLEQLDLTAHATLEAALEAAEDKAVVRTYKLSNVTDTEAPVPQVVGVYGVEEDGTLLDATVEALDGEDVSYLIPSKAKTHVDVKIPAIYAVDNYSAYKDLTLTRTLLDEDGNTIALDGEGIVNEEDTTTSPKVTKAKTNEEATVYFRAKGTYTVRYRATDGANNTKDVSYKIVVTDSLVDVLAPTITLNGIPASTKPGQTVRFAEPTYVDYGSAGSTTIIDSRIKKDVYYYYGNVDDELDLDDAEAVKAYFDAKVADAGTKALAKDEDGKYAFDVEEDTLAEYVTVLVRAEDDAKYADGNADNNVAYTFKTIAIYGSNDNAAPTIVTNLALVAEALENENYGQNEVVNLGTISYTDTTDGVADATKFLTSTLSVYDKNGTEIKVSGVKYEYDGNYFNLKDGKFVTTVAGTYQVVITTTDLGGNSVVHSLQFEVEDTKAPVVEVGSVETTMELGKTYTLEAPVVVDDGVVITNRADSQVEFGANNPSYMFNAGTMEFTPLEKGTYTFRFVGKDAANNPAYSDYYTVTVADTIKPVITLDETLSYKINATAEYKDENGDVIDVELPLFTATDEYNGIKSSSVTVKDPDNEELPVTLKDGTHYVFTPNKNGVFTVTYKAVDLAGNSTTETYTIKVGDITPATITVDAANIPGTFNVGETLSIDLSKVKTVDDVDGEVVGTDGVKDDAKTKLAITLTNPSGTSVTFDKEDEIWSYEFSTAGTYTLKFKATDSAGNADDVVYTFEVKANTASTTSAEKAWGIALTVVAVVLLAGVIVYFVKTKDAGEAKPEKAKKEDK